MAKTTESKRHAPTIIAIRTYADDLARAQAATTTTNVPNTESEAAVPVKPTAPKVSQKQPARDIPAPPPAPTTKPATPPPAPKKPTPLPPKDLVVAKAPTVGAPKKPATPPAPGTHEALNQKLGLGTKKGQPKGKQSILSTQTEHTIEDKETTGTIITDTKRHRWSLFRVMKQSISENFNAASDVVHGWFTGTSEAETTAPTITTPPPQSATTSTTASKQPAIREHLVETPKTTKATTKQTPSWTHIIENPPTAPDTDKKPTPPTKTVPMIQALPDTPHQTDVDQPHTKADKTEAVVSKPQPHKPATTVVGTMVTPLPDVPHQDITLEQHLAGERTDATPAAHTEATPTDTTPTTKTPPSAPPTAVVPPVPDVPAKAEPPTISTTPQAPRAIHNQLLQPKAQPQRPSTIPSNVTPQRSNTPSILNRFFVPVLTLLLVIAGVAIITAGALYVFNSTDQATPVSVVPSLLRTNTQTPLVLPNSRAEFLTSLSNAREQAVTGITQLYFTIPNATGERITATAADLLAVLAPRMPGSFLRNIDGLTIGVYTDGESEPFMVIKGSNFDTTFAGMIGWEPFISEDVAPFFGETITASGNSDAFSDTVVVNRDVRVLEDERGIERLLYTIVNQNTAVITTNRDTLDVLIGAIQ